VIVVRPGVRGSGVTVDPERVRQARIMAGLSLAQLGGGEVSRAFLNMVERGLERPSPTILSLIARRTGQPLTYFMRSATSAALTGKELSAELSSVASRVRRFVALNALNSTERQALKMVELSLRHGAALTRGMPSKAQR
jgi:transcriptional regulator with XRE-family HTH domain